MEDGILVATTNISSDNALRGSSEHSDKTPLFTRVQDSCPMKRTNRFVTKILAIFTSGVCVLLVGCQSESNPSSSSTELADDSAVPPPPVATAPAAASAGELNVESFRETRAGYSLAPAPADVWGIPNGTPVQAKEPFYAAYEALPRCQDIQVNAFPVPTSALAATYANAAQSQGVGLLMKFADSASAKKYFDFYAAQIEACVSKGSESEPTFSRVVLAGDSILDRRTYNDGSLWSESVQLDGDQVSLFSVPDGHSISDSALGSDP